MGSTVMTENGFGEQGAMNFEPGARLCPSTPVLSHWRDLKDSLDVQVSQRTVPHSYVLAFSTAKTFCMTTTSLPSYVGEMIFSHPMGA